ncbi:hypothetical protein K440DRAFT_620747 [Wilcoxina mikolae CBS 423.85]|nr:hypothetical protein K440DRAFT_620747 [Wilcoxina mikolae CBS 423.85]
MGKKQTEEVGKIWSGDITIAAEEVARAIATVRFRAGRSGLIGRREKWKREKRRRWNERMKGIGSRRDGSCGGGDVQGVGGMSGERRWGM